MFPVALSLGGMLMRVAALAVVPRVIRALSRTPQAEASLPASAEVQQTLEKPEPVVTSPAKVQKTPARRWTITRSVKRESAILCGWWAPTGTRGPPSHFGGSRSWAYTHRRSFPMNRIDPSGTIFTASLRVLENQDSGTLAHPAGDLDISASLIAGARGFFPVRITISAQVLLGGIWTDVPVTGLIRGGQSGFSYGEETRYIEGGDLDTVRARIAGQVLENAACSGATELKLSVIVGQSSAAGMLGFFNTPAIFQASFSLKRHGIVGEQKSYTAAPPLQQWRGTQ